MLVPRSWEGSVSDRGGLRVDFRVMVIWVGGEGGEVDAVRGSMGWEVRGRVYYFHGGQWDGEMRREGGGRERTGPFGSKVLGSATWSAWSLIGLESRVERNDLAKDSSVILLRCRG